MNSAVLESPFVRTALSFMFTILIAALLNNKAFDAINQRTPSINAPHQ